jgi:hypothetical protein
MPATLTTPEGRPAVPLPHGPEGLWNALLRSDPDHDGLPLTRIPLDQSPRSMFAYDPAAGIPVDHDHSPTSQDITE